MKFYSTNHKSPEVDFETALMRGLAEDGGLYMPQEWPRPFLQAHKVFKVHQVLKEFIDIPETDLKKIIKDAFSFPVPLKKLNKNLYILELFHGPTLSFKDFGARFMARAMDFFVARNQKLDARGKLNIIVATSGDTGSAVASAFYGLKNINVFILYPSKRISPLQEKQIATFGKNIFALEVKGDFDDCQKLAKQALSDTEIRKKINLSSANSINIGRLLPQMFYYFSGYQQFQSLNSKSYIPDPYFVVPSGNFGNLTAGLFAKKIGLPVKKFIAAVNINSGVPEYLKTGNLPIKETKMTFSNAMDVANPSNWARILDLYQNNLTAIKKDLEAITVSEAETKKTIGEVYKKYGYIADPHTAVGLAAAKKASLWLSSSFVVLATAHPAKFPEIVEKTIGKKVFLPSALRTASQKPQNSTLISKRYQDLSKLLLTESHDI